MKKSWLEQMKYCIKAKQGSSIVMLAMVFVAFAVSICGSIMICRALVVKSECRAFGTVWTSAILSEYDRYLLDEYGLMAYWGNESEVQKRLDSYIAYSASGKLDAGFGASSAELTGYELGIPDNFRKAMRNNFLYSGTEDVIDRRKRVTKDDTKGDRRIANRLVINTLPSSGLNTSVDVDSVAEKIKKAGNIEKLTDSVSSAGVDIQFIRKMFGNKLTSGCNDNAYFNNEWEYIISGKPDDDDNFKACRRKLFLLRNALNLAFLYKDSGKREALVAASELITPGPGAVLTQAVIAEVWAAAETEEDIKTLLDNGRVPFIKTDLSWKTDLGSIIDSKDIAGKLDDESKELLKENEEIIKSNVKGQGVRREITDGQTYDDYLLFMIATLNENARILRIMDLVQINMKFEHYRDFNLMEYYVGVRYNIKANGRTYEFEDKYK